MSLFLLCVFIFGQLMVLFGKVITTHLTSFPLIPQTSSLLSCVCIRIPTCLCVYKLVSMCVLLCVCAGYGICGPIYVKHVLANRLDWSFSATFFSPLLVFGSYLAGALGLLLMCLGVIPGSSDWENWQCQELDGGWAPDLPDLVL